MQAAVGGSRPLVGGKVPESASAAVYTPNGSAMPSSSRSTSTDPNLSTDHSGFAIVPPSADGQEGFSFVPLSEAGPSSFPSVAQKIRPPRQMRPPPRPPVSNAETSFAAKRLAARAANQQPTRLATLQLEALIPDLTLQVARSAPPPQHASAVTLSHRSRYSPKVIFPAKAWDQTGISGGDSPGPHRDSDEAAAMNGRHSFTSRRAGNGQAAQPSFLAESAAEPLALSLSAAEILAQQPAVGTSASRSLQAEAALAPVSPSTNGLPSPSISLSGVAESAVDATTSTVSSSFPPSSPTTSGIAQPRKAWTAPRSWAELATRSTATNSGKVVTASIRHAEHGLDPARAGVSAQQGERTSSHRQTPALHPNSPPQHAHRAASSAGNSSALYQSAQASPSSTRPSYFAASPKIRSDGVHTAQHTLKTLGLEALLEGAETKFRAPLTYPRGMINKGNFCFANAILQVLIYCAPFFNLFTLIGREIPRDFTGSTPLMEAVIQFLREFHVVPNPPAKQMTHGTEAVAVDTDTEQELHALSEPFVPEFVYDAMRLNKRFDAMRRGHQEDAEEFLGFFLDTLHEELLSAMRKSAAKLTAHGAPLARLSAVEKKMNGLSDEDVARLDSLGSADSTEEREVLRPMSPGDDGWMEVGQKGKTAFTRTTATSDSPITRIFGGKLRSVLRTPGAKDSVTLEPYQPLQLDIQPTHVNSIDEALRNLSVPEIIPGVMSPTKGLVDATKQVFIETLPPVLILHLKRFVFDEVGGVQKSSKDVSYETTLDIKGDIVSPTRRSDLKGRYRLFGVVYHHGRYASGGHYTVDVLRQDRSEWLHIDDTTWSRCAAPGSGEAVTKSRGHDGVAYLLFYAREDALSEDGKDSTAIPKVTVESSAHVNGVGKARSTGVMEAKAPAAAVAPKRGNQVPLTAETVAAPAMAAANTSTKPEHRVVPGAPPRIPVSGSPKKKAASKAR